MTRVNLGKQHPEAYQAVIALDATVRQATQDAGLDPKLVERVKIRVSQLNGRAFGRLLVGDPDEHLEPDRHPEPLPGGRVGLTGFRAGPPSGIRTLTLFTAVPRP